METSPSLEANSSSASQEISHILFNPDVSLPCAQKPNSCLDPEPDKSSPHPIIVRSILIHPSTLISSRFPYKNLVCISLLPYACYTPHSSQVPWSDRTNDTWCHEFSSLCSILENSVSSSPLGPNIFVSFEFRYLHSLCPALNMRNQVSRP